MPLKIKLWDPKNKTEMKEERMRNRNIERIDRRYLLFISILENQTPKNESQYEQTVKLSLPRGVPFAKSLCVRVLAEYSILQHFEYEWKCRVRLIHAVHQCLLPAHWEEPLGPERLSQHVPLVRRSDRVLIFFLPRPTGFFTVSLWILRGFHHACVFLYSVYMLFSVLFCVLLNDYMLELDYSCTVSGVVSNYCNWYIWSCCL